MAESKNIIFILGMHRSGTSAATRLLNLLGVKLGSNLIAGIKNINNAGFWENKDFVQINENILHDFNSTWFDTRLLPKLWWNNNLCLPYKETIKQIINRDFHKQSLIGVKDPRLCRLLPLWLMAVTELNFEAKCLLVIRNPYEVAASLFKRDGINQSTAFYLWLQYVLESELYSRKILRTVIDYNEIIINWKKTAFSIEKHLKIKWSNSMEQSAKKINEQISLKQRHHNISLKYNDFENELIEIAMDVYFKLSNGNHENFHNYFDNIRKQINEKDLMKDFFSNALFDTNQLLLSKIKELTSIVEKRDGQLEEQNKKILELRKEHGYAIGIVKERDNQLEVQNKKILELGKNHGYAISVVEERDSQLKKQNKKILELNYNYNYTTKIIKKKDRQLNDLKSKFNKLNKLDNMYNEDSKITRQINDIDRKKHFSPKLSEISYSKTIDIIIPIYKGFKEVKNCLESILQYKQEHNFDIIIINDLSPDTDIEDYLTSIASKNPNITILKNKVNLGFVASVNIGMALHNDRDVILLNSDTVVSNNWLDRLHQCVYKLESTGTVTPFSNNATICSFPIFCKNNNLSSKWTAQEIDKAFSEINKDAQSVEIPTAVGFCMYIKRRCLNDVGLFDVKNFGRGYGEENDFCMRATKKGWRHKLCADTFVYHTGGVSFSVEKEKRIAVAMETMNKLHYKYHQLVHEHIAQNPASGLRVNAMIHLIRKSLRPVVLFLSHNLGGGTEKHIEELVSVNKTKMDVIIIRPGVNGETILSLGTEIESESLYFFLPEEYWELVKFCKYLQVSRIHFHHIMGLETSLWGLYKDLDVCFDITFHDYYFINANPKLVSIDMKFCYDSKTRDNLCTEAYPIPGDVTPEKWRDNQAVLLKNADRIFAPSQYMADLIKSYFPYIQPIVTYHPDWEQDAPYPDVKLQKISVNESIRILVLGAISKEKGGSILESCGINSKRKGYPIEFHIIGYAYKKLNKAVIEHGVYQNEHLSKMIDELKPHLIWFPALWPETYSYTLSEALRTALPIVAPDIGSFPERLLKRPFTWIKNWNQSIFQWLDLFLSIRKKLLNVQNYNDKNLWAQDYILGCNKFSYSKDYLVISDKKFDYETVLLDVKWINYYSNRIIIQSKQLQHTQQKYYNYLLGFCTKIKENTIGLKIVNCIPTKVKHVVKKIIL